MTENTSKTHGVDAVDAVVLPNTIVLARSVLPSGQGNTVNTSCVFEELSELWVLRCRQWNAKTQLSKN